MVSEPHAKGRQKFHSRDCVSSMCLAISAEQVFELVPMWCENVDHTWWSLVQWMGHALVSECLGTCDWNFLVFERRRSVDCGYVLHFSHSTQMSLSLNSNAPLIQLNETFTHTHQAQTSGRITTPDLHLPSISSLDWTCFWDGSFEVQLDANTFETTSILHVLWFQL